MLPPRTSTHVTYTLMHEFPLAFLTASVLLLSIEYVQNYWLNNGQVMQLPHRVTLPVLSFKTVFADPIH